MTAYSPQQYEQNYPAGIENYFWNLARNHIIIDALRANGLAGKRVLEVGCGPGIVVRYLRAHGIDCDGCDLGMPPVPPDLAGQIHTGTDACDLDEAVRNQVEVLLLCDVLEHVPDPVLFLERLRAAYPKAAHLVVTVPARREVWSNYDDHFGHRCRYDRPTLAREMEGAGFPVTRVRYCFHALYLVMLLVGLVRRRRSVAFQVPGWLGLHRWMACYCQWESKLLPGSMVGSSLVAVAHRRPDPSEPRR